jgi:hypothetical protein
MKKTSTIALAMFILAAPFVEARRRAVAPVPDHSLAIEFVDDAGGTSLLSVAGSEAWLDLQKVAHAGASGERVTRLRRRVGIKVVRVEGTAPGVAAVRARIDASDGRASYRINGRPLGRMPLLIDARAPIGSPVFHTLEIDVPIHAADGALTASITWEVTEEP